MRPNGKKKNKDEDEIKREAEAAEAWYETFVAATEEIMSDRKKGGHEVNAGYQIGYFVLYLNIFHEMNLFNEESKKQIIRLYTKNVSEYMDRITVVDIINHFEELYSTVTEDAQGPEELTNAQKRYIVAMEMELLGTVTPDIDKVGDCLLIAGNHISKTMEMLSEL